MAERCDTVAAYAAAGAERWIFALPIFADESELEREIVPLLRDQRTGLLVSSPLAGGLLSGKYSRENQKPEDSRRSAFDFPIVDKERTWRILDVLRPVAEAHSTSVAAVALAWVARQPGVTCPVIGPRTLAQLEASLAALDIDLPDDAWKRLDTLFPGPGGPAPEAYAW